MAFFGSKVTVDLSPLHRLRGQVAADLSGAGGGSISRAVKQRWPDTYLAFLRRKYQQNAAGGGDWPPLAASTLASSPPRRGIMRVTDAIYRALNRGEQGNMIEPIPGGVRVGINGGSHPGADLTIGELAAIHHNGNSTKNLPARPIIYPPDPNTVRQMGTDFVRGFGDAVKSAVGGFFGR